MTTAPETKPVNVKEEEVGTFDMLLNSLPYSSMIRGTNLAKLVKQYPKVAEMVYNYDIIKYLESDTGIAAVTSDGYISLAEELITACISASTQDEVNVIIEKTFLQYKPKEEPKEKSDAK